jgi:universal stress protein A
MEEISMSLYQHILAAVDLGKNSSAVVQKAAELALLCNAELTVTHVVEVFPAPDVDYVMPVENEAEAALIEAAEKQLQQLLAQTAIKGDVKSTVVSGRPKVEILRIADQVKADLIVAGAHGRHGLRGLLGSTTDRILHQTRCDVLTVCD